MTFYQRFLLSVLLAYDKLLKCSNSKSEYVFVSSVSVLKDLPSEQLAKIADVLEIVSFIRGVSVCILSFDVVLSLEYFSDLFHFYAK